MELNTEAETQIRNIVNDLPGAVRFLTQAQDNRDQIYNYKTPGGDPSSPISAFSQVLSSRSRCMGYLLTFVPVASAAAAQCKPEPIRVWPEYVRTACFRATKPADYLVDCAVAFHSSLATCPICLRTTSFWTDAGTPECIWETSLWSTGVWTIRIRCRSTTPATTTTRAAARRLWRRQCVRKASIRPASIRTIGIWPAISIGCRTESVCSSRAETRCSQSIRRRAIAK